jgi:hypothetical protein
LSNYERDEISARSRAGSLAGERLWGIRRLAILALIRWTPPDPKSALAKIVADVGLARRGKNPGVAEGAISE